MEHIYYKSKTRKDTVYQLCHSNGEIEFDYWLQYIILNGIADVFSPLETTDLLNDFDPISKADFDKYMVRWNKTYTSNKQYNYTLKAIRLTNKH